MENLAYWMAFHLLLGNRDTQSRNVYIYSPLNSNKWYFYSWDNDGMLKRNEYALSGRSDGMGWEDGVSNYWGNVLFQRALKTSSFRQALDAAVEDLMDYFTAERINGMVNEYSAIVKPYVYRMPDIEYAPLTETQYDQIGAALYSEIQTNYQSYKESFLNPMPFFIATPVSEDGQFVYQWEAAYDFNAENITYTFELATDYTFANPLIRQEGVVIPEIRGDALPAGQYFIRVTAKNESGREQYAFDYYTFANPLIRQEGVVIPEIRGDALPAGQYFIRVTAKNESGREQYAFDYYVIESGKVYGTKCFYVGEDGTIVEDVYVEE